MVTASYATYEVAFTVVVITGVTGSPFSLTTPCVSQGFSQVLYCSVSTPANGSLVIANEEALNGIGVGIDSTLLVNQGAEIQDIGLEYMTTPYQQSNLAITFNQAVGDTNIMNGNNIWIMTADSLT